MVLYAILLIEPYGAGQHAGVGIVCKACYKRHSKSTQWCPCVCVCVWKLYRHLQINICVYNFK